VELVPERHASKVVQDRSWKNNWFMCMKCGSGKAKEWALTKALGDFLFMRAAGLFPYVYLKLGRVSL
jgi:hypothetical protein